MRFHMMSILKNKYLIALLLVLVWVCFFDKNNLLYQRRLRKQLNELERNREFFIQEIMRDSTAIRELTENPEALERYAREKYLMKKQGEDIFIIME